MTLLTIKERRALCRAKGQVYDVKTKRCRPRKSRRRSTAAAPKRTSSGSVAPARRPRKSPRSSKKGNGARAARRSNSRPPPTDAEASVQQLREAVMRMPPEARAQRPPSPRRRPSRPSRAKRPSSKRRSRSRKDDDVVVTAVQMNDADARLRRAQKEGRVIEV